MRRARPRFRRRRRGDVGPQGVQRPGRVHHGLGALPRLPDRGRALRALRPSLPRGRSLRATLRQSPWDAIIGCSVIVVIAGCVSPPDAAPCGIARRRRARPRRPGRARRPRARVPALAAHAHGRIGFRERPALERPRLRSPLAMLAYTGLETAATWRRRRASRAGSVRAHSSRGSAWFVVVNHRRSRRYGLLGLPDDRRLDRARGASG